MKTQAEKQRQPHPVPVAASLWWESPPNPILAPRRAVSCRQPLREQVCWKLMGNVGATRQDREEDAPMGGWAMLGL